MRSKKRTNSYIMGTILTIATSAWVFAICFADESQTEKPADEKPDGNNKCYVCHPSLQTEEITTVHLEMGISCDECHGPSVEHMHDEMLMTKSDFLFGRAEVRGPLFQLAHASNRSCLFLYPLQCRHQYRHQQQ